MNRDNLDSTSISALNSIKDKSRYNLEELKDGGLVSKETLCCVHAEVEH